MTRRIDKPDTAADLELQRCLRADPPQSFIMVAGAGSGKTTSLIKGLSFIDGIMGERLRRNSQRVACITYTEIAVGEIRGDVGLDQLFDVSTIHSFLWSIIRPFQRDIGKWVAKRLEAKRAELLEQQAAFSSRVQQKTRDRVAAEILELSADLAKIGSVTSFTYGTGSDYLNGVLGHDDIIKLGTAMIEGSDNLALIVALKYPVMFVDESQDTAPEVVQALKSVQLRHGDKFCLGFFGDPMQKIYATGAGPIAPEKGWVTITKPENFRCPQKVLNVINVVRGNGDGLKQTGGRHVIVGDSPAPVQGVAKAFVIPNSRKSDADIAIVRSKLSADLGDPLWLEDKAESDVKILVVVHRMAAVRLGFGQLYAAFTDGASESFKAAFMEGTHWALRPFLNFILPLTAAANAGHEFAVVQLLKRYSHALQPESFSQDASPTAKLKHLKELTGQLASQLSPDGSATVRDVLDFVAKNRLYPLDDRLTRALSQSVEPQSNGASDEASKEDMAIDAYLVCPAREVWGYVTYIQDESPYSTQQGIKGAEFDRVLVVLDDAEGTHIHFSYDKLLGLKAPSATDERNLAEGKDTVFDRTRRLFYVCCSRAVQDLAVVYYSDDPEKAVEQMSQNGFDAADVTCFPA